MAKKKKSKKTKKAKGNSGIDGAIVKYIDTSAKSETSLNKLYRHFEKKYSTEKIEASLMRLERRALIHFTDKGRVKRSEKSANQKNALIGKMDLSKSGIGYVEIEGFKDDIKIPRKYTKNAMKNDLVEVQIIEQKRSKLEGKVVRIVKRMQHEFICTFQKTEGFGFGVPSYQNNVPFDIFIPESLTMGAKMGDTVVVHIINWNDSAGKSPVGKVVEKLSGLSENELEMRSILMEHGFNLVFPSDVEKETSKISEKISAIEKAERLDYRKILTFTIDPVDAKDFDDAISIQILENGNKEIGVHIADVSHYVKPNSALDIEAQIRATSVYLPDRVCPMLPEKLSNKVCSLRPNEEKLCFSVLFEVAENNIIKHYTFAKTIIKSNRRFTYQEVQDILEAKKGEYAEELIYLNSYAKHLRKTRLKNGAINFDSEEVRFKLDKNAVPIDVYVKERKDAHLLVEDYMLLANTTVAKYFSANLKKNKRQAGVYRVHGKPDLEKLNLLSNIAKRFGISLSFKDEEQARDVLNNLMRIIENKPELSLLGNLAIRSMAKAAYTSKNIGHYGLSFEDYTHFTSPIRRYPDVLTHRILLNQLQGKRARYTDLELEELLVQSNIMEREAQKAEREAIKYKQVEYLSKRIGEVFEGIISGVIARGFFVELSTNKCEGFVTLQNENEEFLFDPEHIRLVGLKSNTIFQIGDKVKVRVQKASLKDKQIDFNFLEKI